MKPRLSDSIRRWYTTVPRWKYSAMALPAYLAYMLRMKRTTNGHVNKVRNLISPKGEIYILETYTSFLLILQ